MEEKLFYHAVAIALESDYRKMATLRKAHKNWESAYADLGSNVAVPDPQAAWKEMEADGIRLTLQEDAAYPKSLREISHPPLAIYSKGVMEKEGFVPFAIVGTRRATSEGKATARRFVRTLAEAGFAIVSGLAFGIDCAAHEGCLDASGSAIAVLANGLDSVYPSTNAPLAERILKNGGVLISEYPPGSPPLPYRFLERNRIVSGLSKGVLVIESPEKSGSLATARFALEQNRDVFVMPGSITHPNFFGSHALIRQGAELVTKPEEILESYGITKTTTITDDHDDVSPEEKLILQALRASSAPLDVDKIIAATKLEPRIANQTITFLILKDTIKESGNGYTMN
jgi:DNA processing protein